MLKEAWTYKLFNQIETVANYVLENRVLNDDGEHIIKGEEIHKTVIPPIKKVNDSLSPEDRGSLERGNQKICKRLSYDQRNISSPNS